MTIKKVEYNQKLKIENQKLKKRLDEAKKELAIKNEKIEVMEASLETMAKVSLELLDYRQPTRVYALFLKEQWYKH
jgi:regulator of replication initiation timing